MSRKRTAKADPERSTSQGNAGSADAGRPSTGKPNAGQPNSDPKPSSNPNRVELLGCDAPLPSVNLRTLISIWVPIHLVALFLSYTSVVEPSSLQSQLVGVMQPYLRATHFATDDVIYLAHGDALEQVHQLQVTTDPGDPRSPATSWETIAPLEGDAIAGLAAADRMQRFLSTIAVLSDQEQPSLIAELLLPMMSERDDVTAVRVRRLPNDLDAYTTEAETVYEGRVVRGDPTNSLVQLREERLNAEARPESLPRTESSSTTEANDG